MLFIAIESGLARCQAPARPVPYVHRRQQPARPVVPERRQHRHRPCEPLPCGPAREQIAGQRPGVPGDGIAPTQELAGLLDRAGYRGYLSLEVFVPGYGAESALEVATRGLASIQGAYPL